MSDGCKTGADNFQKKKNSRVKNRNGNSVDVKNKRVASEGKRGEIETRESRRDCRLRKFEIIKSELSGTDWKEQPPVSSNVLYIAIPCTDSSFLYCYYYYYYSSSCS